VGPGRPGREGVAPCQPSGALGAVTDPACWERLVAEAPQTPRPPARQGTPCDDLPVACLLTRSAPSTSSVAFRDSVFGMKTMVHPVSGTFSVQRRSERMYSNQPVSLWSKFCRYLSFRTDVSFVLELQPVSTHGYILLMIRGDLGKHHWHDKFQHESTPRFSDHELLPAKSPSKQNDQERPSLKSQAVHMLCLVLLPPQPKDVI
jgi:hypothetical protein